MKNLLMASVFLLVIATCHPASNLYASTTVTIPIAADMHTDSQDPTTSLGKLNKMWLGYGKWEGDGENHMFFKYTLENLAEIDINSIRKVSLNIYQNVFDAHTEYGVVINRDEGGWSEKGTNWDSIEIDTTDHQSFQTIPLILDWVSIDITDVFLENLSFDSSTGNIVIFQSNPGQGGGSFISRECYMLQICLEDLSPFITVEVREADYSISNISIEEGEDMNILVKWSSNFIPDEGYTISISSNDTEIIREDGVKENWYIANLPDYGDYTVVVEIPNANYSSDLYTYQFREILPESPSNPDEEIDEVEDSDEPDEIDNHIDDREVMERVYSPGQVIKEITENIEGENSRGVLGLIAQVLMDRNSCTYTLNPSGKVVSKTKCKITDPKLNKVTARYASNTGTYIEATIKLPKIFDITVNRLGCKKPSITNPITFIKCVEYIKSTETFSINTSYLDIYINVDGKWIQAGKRLKDDEYIAFLNLSNKVQRLETMVRYNISSSTKLPEGVWVDIFEGSNSSNKLTFKLESATKPPYSFPVDRLVNVTQWHGKTAYNSNHTGIDFETKNFNVKATSDGTIEYIGWDNSSGKCLSGGNYILLRHKDGRFSTYLHLKSFSKGIKKGSTVKKGAVIGVSGNTGYYNCEKLANHLHFEIRNKAKQSSHIDPVPLIDTDWSKVKTARANLYPGRLSGNNPHPKY